MKEIIFKFGIGIIFITYCLFNERKLTDTLFTLLLIEMVVVGLSQLLLK
jgi:hypothetical protein